MSSHELDPETVAAIKREAARAIWARLSENGENVAALRVLQEARKLYGDPPPPKKVRAELECDGSHAEWGRTTVRITCESGQRVTLWRKDLHALAALDARADAEGMVQEGETDPLGGECIHGECPRGFDCDRAKPCPDATPALGTPGNPVTREQAYKVALRFMDYEPHSRYEAKWRSDMAAALRAIGLEVEA